MSFSKKGMLHWCLSVEETFQPRENISSKQKQIPEQFLATAIRYLRAACAEITDEDDAPDLGEDAK